MADVERGVSPVLAYTLTIGIGTLLVAGLVVAAGGYVENQRELTTERELEVIGQQVSADIAAADRLARTDGAEVEVTRTLQSRSVGAQYTIEVVDDAPGPTEPYLRLSTSSPDVTVEVGVVSVTPVGERRVGGGDIVVVLENGQLEVYSA